MLVYGKQWGITLIELMVGLVILSVLLSLAAASYQGWIQNQQIRTAAESILNGLQIARAEAVKNNSNVRFVLCGLNNPTPNSSWDILAISAGAPVPAVSPNCLLGVSPPVAGEIRIQDRNGNEGSQNAVVAVQPAGNHTITFDGLGRVVGNVDGSAPVTQFDITNPNGGTRPLSVTQAAGGAVRMCDPSPNLPLTDPRHC